VQRDGVNSVRSGRKQPQRPLPRAADHPESFNFPDRGSNPAVELVSGL